MGNVHFPFNLTVTQGDDRPIQFVFDDADGNPVDISLWQFFYTAKADLAAEDTEAAIALEPDDFVLTDGGAGTVNTASATIPRTATALMAAGSYHHDIQVVKPGGAVLTLGAGTLVIESQVTRRTS